MNKLLKQKKWIIFILMFLNFLISFKIIGLLPQNRELVTIVATGERNIKSSGDEIWLRNIIVDGKNYDISKPLNGKWIWGNIDGKDILGWRGYNTPHDITNKVEIEIPSGRNIDLVFEKNIWRGIVNIGINGKKYILDCYENTTDLNNIVSQRIDNNNNDFILNQKIFCIIFICIFSIILLLIEHIMFKNNILISLSNCFPNIKENILFIFMLTIMIAIVFKTSDVSMWNDEIITLTSVYNKDSLFGAIENNIKFIDMSPPLFNFFSYFWIKIVPFGEIYLYILPSIFTFLGIFILYLLSNLLFNKEISLFISFLSSTSYILILNGAHEYRPYSLLFLSSCLVLYSYFKKQRNNSFKNTVLFSISMIFLLYSHYYGIIFCFCIFLYDLLVNLSLKNIRFLIPYVISGIVYLPWIIILLLSNHKQLVGWASNPQIYDLIKLPSFLLNNDVLVFIFGAGIFYIITIVLNDRNKTNTDQRNLIALLFILCSTVSLVYILSIYLLKGLFYPRYFIVILPIIFLITGYAINLIIKNLRLNNKKILYCLFISLFLSTSIRGYEVIKINPKMLYQPYRETLFFIKSKTDINNNDVCIIVPPDCKGGVDYFITEKGKIDTPNILNSNDISVENFEKYINKYNKVYLINIHVPLQSEFENILKINYKNISEFQQYGLIIYEK